MAKKTVVKEKYAGHKRPMPGMEIKTPSLKKIKPDEIDYLGNKLADLSQRVKEVELSIDDLAGKIKRVMGRMGL